MGCLFYHVFMPAPIPFVSCVEQEEIMDALCVEPFDSKALNACIQNQNRKRTLSGIGRLQEDLPRAAGVTDLETLSRQLVSTYLRLWVVEWILSGFIEKGEQPQSRDLNKAPGVLKVLRDYSPRMACRLFVFPKGRVRFALEVGRPEEPDARAGLLEPRFKDSASKAWDEAARLLYGLMMSDWAHRLCQCPHCEAFFVKKKLRKTPYIHGTFCCRGHQSHASAVASTEDSRAAIRDELVGRAARWLQKWGICPADWRDDSAYNWRDDSAYKEDLASDLSESLLCRRLRREVRANWVTRHQDAIEQKRLELIAERRGGVGSRL
jgi:hypothetical protein